MTTKKKMTLSRLKKMKMAEEKIVCLTAYDATMGYWLDQAGVDVILVGDTLGMVVQGHQTTLPVTLQEMVYHTQMVQRGNQYAWCVADFPFMSDISIEKACESAAMLMKEGHANMVKLEGGSPRTLAIVERLSELGVPVCGHLGLLPQSVEKNGYRRAGKDEASAKVLLESAIALEKAGAEMLVLECVPDYLAGDISRATSIPVIGIGSGGESDGQVLVLTDILGTSVGGIPPFAKNYLASADSIQQAIQNYVDEVRNKQFPRQL